MKKVLLATVTLLLFIVISCNDAKKTDDASNSQAEKNRQDITAIYKGIETGDMSSMDSMLADDAVDHATPGDIKGKDAIKKMLSDMHNHVSNLKLELIADATSASGDYHFALARLTGTTTDTTMGRPANTSLDQTSVDVIKMVNGKASEHWGFEDPKMIMKMMSMNMPPAGEMKMDDKMMDKKDTMPKKK